MLSSSGALRAALGVAGAGAAGVGYALLEARAFTLRHVSLPVLPAGARSLRVLHVSDLHLVPRQRRKAGWLRGLAALEPDLVVSTGDNLAATDAVPAVLDAYGELLDRPGVFVLGSNDYWGPRPKNPARYFLPQGGRRRVIGIRLPTDELVSGFTAAGWLDLTNARGRLDVGDTTLDFVGVDDPHMRYDRYPEHVAAEPGTVLVGVTHAPYRRILDAMTADGADVVLAGHTHGGQLCLPVAGALVTNCDLPRRQARGVSSWSAAGRTVPLHVSAGLGTNPYAPVRFACRPEATLLTLTPRP
ncbi:MAG TPA: metallophosphoesterase [Kineosporiaceae bacterium]|nr:metallophosphoesterase [Kineosporiaceae bacterium]